MSRSRAFDVGSGLRGALLALSVVSCSAAAAKEAAAAPRFQVTGSSAAPQARPARPAPRPSLQVFWTTFRKAALAGEAAGVAALTRFPFRTRGELDGDPWALHSREAFPPVLARLLRQDTGLSAEEEPLARLIERTTSLPEPGGPAGTTARLASMVFEVVDGTWMLTAAYLAE